MKKIVRILSILFVFAILFMASMPGLASPPDNAAGDWYYHPRLNELEVDKVVGGNTFLALVEDSNWNGTFSGDSEECVALTPCATSVDYGSGVFYASGRGFFKVVVSFASVTVDGKTGSLEMKVNGSRSDPDSDWVCKWVIISGEGELAGLRGQGDCWGPGWQEVPGEWGVVHYLGNYHFELVD